MPIGPKRMPFFDHVVELRRRLIVIIVTLLVGVVGIYSWSLEIYDVIMEPVSKHLPNGVFYIAGPWEAFTFRFKVSLYAAIVITSPIILWQALAFFLPALKPKERRWFMPTFVAVLALFVLGNWFCWRYVLDPAMAWSIGQLGGNIESLPSAQLFLNGITLLLLGFGFAFQLPVIVFYLVAFGVVPYATLRRNWRYVYVVLMVVAAGATPDFSPWVMLALGVVLVVLYEGSLLMARLVLRKRIQAQREAEEADDVDDEDEDV